MCSDKNHQDTFTIQINVQWNFNNAIRAFIPWVFWQPLWGCTFSKLPHTPLHTGLHLACASWWCLCAPSPTCHGWVTHRTLWVCYIWALGSAGWWPGHRLQWSGGGPARPGWQNGSQMSRTPEEEGKEEAWRRKKGGTQLINAAKALTPTKANSATPLDSYLTLPFHQRLC